MIIITIDIIITIISMKKRRRNKPPDIHVRKVKNSGDLVPVQCPRDSVDLCLLHFLKTFEAHCLDFSDLLYFCVIRVILSM